MKLKSLHLLLEQALREQTPSWQSEAKTILCHKLDLSPIDLILEKEMVLPLDKCDEIMHISARRLTGEPLQYILGTQNFMGLEFKVDPSVLIPRPETEILVEWVIDRIQEGACVLDVGTGSGAIAIALAKASKRVRAVAVDISSEAIDLAKENALVHNVDQQIDFRVGNLFKPLKKEKFQWIVSNPPYIPLSDAPGLMKEVVEYEPHVALFGGEDGLDLYRIMIPKALEFLDSKGTLVFEAGHDQSEAIQELFRLSGYVDVGVFTDLCQVPRFIYGKKA